MDCIILAGGFGTRLRSVVADRPKPLAEINGVPFLDLLLRKCKAALHDAKVVLAVGYLGEQIAARYTQVLISQEERPLGTGGAIVRALKQTTSEHVLILNGDSYLEFDFAPFYAMHVENDADITLVYRYVRDASRYGTLQVESGRIVDFAEKKLEVQEGLINGGVYLMKRTLFEGLGLGESFSLERDAFPLLLKKRAFGYPCSGLFIDIGTPESFLEAQTLLKSLCL